jgi:hypothetical protein
MFSDSQTEHVAFCNNELMVYESIILKKWGGKQPCHSISQIVIYLYVFFGILYHLYPATVCYHSKLAKTILTDVS